MKNLAKLGCVGLGVLSLAGCPEDPVGNDTGTPGVDAFVPEGVDAGPLPDAFAPSTDDTGTPADDAFVGNDAFTGGDDCDRTGYPALSLVDVAGDYDWVRPVYVTHAPGSSDLYVVDARGFIYIVRAGAVLATPFLNVSSLLSGTPSGGAEWGLLGLAFHPDYATNGRFFIGYTPNGGDNIVAEGRRSTASADVADAAVTTVLSVDDFTGNHNGGMVAFGPDGYLYIGTGDGGGGGDPRDTAQDPDNLLGKMLRIDVDTVPAGETYGIPATNPFAAAGDGVRDEIWAFGYRNPWRFSFDRLTGEMYVADVGQGTWEEVDVEPAGAGGRNYGWSQFEGTHNFPGGDSLRMGDTHTPPVYEYEHDSSTELLRNAISITGGYVYRGAIEGLRGAYVFGDLQAPELVAFRYCDGEVRGAARLDLGGAVSGVVSFGEDDAGELYLVSFGSGAEVRRFTAR